MAYPWTIVFLVAVTMVLGCCAADPNAEFIMGRWYYNDPHLNNLSGESHLESWWDFRKGMLGTFEHYTCCFVKSYEKGNYRVVESDDTTLVLELFNVKGHAEGYVQPMGDTRMIKIRIDRESDTIKIEREGPLERILP
jgi:hypothetical protein